MSKGPERIQKIIAGVGIASRRKAEELIIEGVVTINGKVAVLGDKAELGKDAIKVRGKLLQTKEPPMTFAFYKPKKVVSTLSDPQGRPCVGDYIKRLKYKLFTVGRLDFMSEGLLLLTNDGALTERITKSKDITYVYHVKVKGNPDAEMMKRLERGTTVNDRRIDLESVKVVEKYPQKSRLQIVLRGSSSSADLKEFIESRGFLVDKVFRYAIGHITLFGIAPGELKTLKPTQIEALFAQPELATRILEEERRYRPDKNDLKDEDEDSPSERRPRAKAKVVIKPKTPSQVRVAPRRTSDLAIPAPRRSREPAIPAPKKRAFFKGPRRGARSGNKSS